MKSIEGYADQITDMQTAVSTRAVVTLVLIECAVASEDEDDQLEAVKRILAADRLIADRGWAELAETVASFMKKQ